mgnify:CR=1 FL=1
MIWRLIDDTARTGQYNMDFDLELAANCNEDEIYVRFYQWDPYCISLGANQKKSEINLELLEKNGFDVVHRPTGGRAIFHSEEITYSVVIPLAIGLSPKEIYQAISEALAKGLVKYSPQLQQIALESIQPNFLDILKQQSGGICFASTAKNELKFSGKKIVGSAQKKLKSVVLQHGSILCGAKHRELVDYFLLPEQTKLEVAYELQQKTIEIETILKEKVDYKRLRNCLTLGFEEQFQIKFEKLTEAPVN